MVMMEDKLVKVLLSAYNGEKYIAQQIDSILEQSYKNIEIYVRDDGSTDKTVQIVEAYVKSGRVHLEKGDNVGFIKSFFWLVENSGEADYYAYADQDDVWFPDKIAMAMEKLEGTTTEKPVLYFSAYDFYDGELNFVAHQKAGKKQPTFRNALVDCMPLGFNTVFNRAVCRQMREHPPKHSCGHDWWTYLVCQGLGEVIYDERATVKYRRHNGNVSAGGMSFFKFQIWRFKKFFLGDYFTNVREMLCEYEKFYKDSLTPADRKMLALFTQKGYHLKVVMKKVFYPARFRQSIPDELMLRMIFLIGRL